MNLKNIIDNYPTKYSLEYKKFPRYHRIWRLKKILNIISTMISSDRIKGKKLLDIGCSDGLFLHIIKKQFNLKLIGIDRNKDAIELALKLNSNITFKKANAETLPFENDSFDFVTCFETLEHIPNREHAMNEIVRVLKPNGMIIISIPIETGLTGFIKRFARSILKTEDSHRGFDEKNVKNYFNNLCKCDLEIYKTPFNIGEIIVIKNEE